MRKFGIASLCWFVFWILFITTSAIGFLGSLPTYMVDAERIDDGYILLENSKVGNAVYVIKNDNIEGINKHNYIDSERAVLITCSSDYYYMVTLKTDVDDTMFKISVINQEMKDIFTSQWLTLPRPGQISDIEYRNGYLSIAEISSNRSKAYRYDIDITDEMNKDKKNAEPPVIDSKETVESNVGFAFANIIDGKLVCNEYGEEQFNTADCLKDACEAFVSATSNDSRWKLERFDSYIVQTILVFLFGIVLILLIPYLNKKHNRMAVLFVVWECMLFVLVGIHWAGYRVLYDAINTQVLLITGTTIGLILFVSANNDISRLEKAMITLASGDLEFKKPPVYGKDMNHIWNSITEICNKFREVNYEKHNIFEAYYRFAPKSIESVLQKSSISDVKSGDSAEFSGTVAIFDNSVRDRAYVRKSDAHVFPELFLKLISEYQEKGMAFLVSTNAEMSRMRVLFDKDFNRTFSFGLEYVHIIQSLNAKKKYINSTIVVHNCNIFYSIIGNEKQSSQIMLASEIEALEESLSIFKDLKINYLMTKEALEKEIQKPETRYVGNLTVDGRREPLEIYQILDVLPRAQRELYLQMRERYEEAVELVKKKDLFLARNVFAEILRTIPDDNVSRWYIYLCEKYLEEPSEKISLSLNN